MTQRLTLSRTEIEALLRELGQELDGAGLRAELFLVGGAAIALAYDMRRMTAHVDGLFEPKRVVYEAAERVASRHPELSPTWLNDGVKGFLPGPDPDARVALDVPGLTVKAASPEYLLALKVQAARVDRDSGDIRLLATAAGACTAGEVLAIAERVVGAERLAPKARYIVEELFGGDTD